MKRITILDLKKQYPNVYNFLATHDLISLEEHRYDLGNENYVNVESYDTYSSESRRYESHKKYIDIQYIIEGEEIIFVSPIASLKIIDDYNPERDITFYQNDIEGDKYLMRSGEMLLLDHDDGHMPCVSVNKLPCRVKKAVFKIKDFK